MSETEKTTPNYGAMKQPVSTNVGNSITELTIADMQGRRQLGIAEYGDELRTHNGRDALLDAYQEALDMAEYLRQMIEQRRNPPQQFVADQVRARGYFEGYDSTALFARQFIKLVEELAELGEHIRPFRLKQEYDPSEFDEFLQMIALLNQAALLARKLFDDTSLWKNGTMASIPMDFAAKELADMQVVLFCAAFALNETCCHSPLYPFNLIQAAIEKSAADVERGVR